jgi:hypothetical protein
MTQVRLATSDKDASLCLSDRSWALRLVAHGIVDGMIGSSLVSPVGGPKGQIPYENVRDKGSCAPICEARGNLGFVLSIAKHSLHRDV